MHSITALGMLNKCLLVVLLVPPFIECLLHDSDGTKYVG